MRFLLQAWTFSIISRLTLLPWQSPGMLVTRVIHTVVIKVLILKFSVYPVLTKKLTLKVKRFTFILILTD